MAMMKVDRLTMRNDGIMRNDETINLQQRFPKEKITNGDQFCLIPEIASDTFQSAKYSDLDSNKASDSPLCYSKRFTILNKRSLHYNKPVTVRWSPQKGFEAILREGLKNFKLLLPQSLSKEVKKIVSMHQFFEYLADAYLKINEFGNGELGLEICRRLKGGGKGDKKRKAKEMEDTDDIDGHFEYRKKPKFSSVKGKDNNNDINNNNNNIDSDDDVSDIHIENDDDVSNNEISLKKRLDEFFKDSVYIARKVEDGTCRYVLKDGQKETCDKAIELIRNLFNANKDLQGDFKTDQRSLRVKIQHKKLYELKITEDKSVFLSKIENKEAIEEIQRVLTIERVNHSTNEINSITKYKKLSKRFDLQKIAIKQGKTKVILDALGAGGTLSPYPILNIITGIMQAKLRLKEGKWIQAIIIGGANALPFFFPGVGIPIAFAVNSIFACKDLMELGNYKEPGKGVELELEDAYKVLQIDIKEHKELRPEEIKKKPEPAKKIVHDQYIKLSRALETDRKVGSSHLEEQLEACLALVNSSKDFIYEHHKWSK